MKDKKENTTTSNLREKVRGRESRKKEDCNSTLQKKSGFFAAVKKKEWQDMGEKRGN